MMILIFSNLVLSLNMNSYEEVKLLFFFKGVPSPVEENSLKRVFPFPMGKWVESHSLSSGGWMLVWFSREGLADSIRPRQQNPLEKKRISFVPQSNFSQSKSLWRKTNWSPLFTAVNCRSLGHPGFFYK